ncbi:transcription factor E4F1 [Chanos chanos]|uniref:Transcription factor E4F1 n=1 Tax=Chanos chanos TaxID=29144 RepID=A0A6J2WRR9_CHACN|nr:transcription factor E4F1 [Chanos chanos]
MSEENNNTAEIVTDNTEHGNIITIQTTLGDEDEDVHKCGRCQTEFSVLDAFIQHKLKRNCKRPQQDSQLDVGSDTTVAQSKMDMNGLSSDDADRSNAADEVDKPNLLTGRRRGNSIKSNVPKREAPSSNSLDPSKLVVRVNEEGRYICHICEKTFKTTNILRTHLSTHSDKKDFKCELCGSAFRTKGSLIRHNRRHTDERPYWCSQCGLSFRESGALTRHLKSLTPCTEKIRFSQCKEILVSKDGVQKGVQASAALPQKEEQQLPVVSVVDNTQEVIHEVHIQMVDESGQVVDQPQAQPVEEGNNLICQAIINSGITLESDSAVATEQAEARSPRQDLEEPEEESRMTEIHVSEECIEMESEETVNTTEKEGNAAPSKVHRCPHCNRVFKALSYLRFHVKGHLGYKPFKCVVCQKEFLTGYLLKKHMEMHLSERRYKCGECGKLYKTIGHVREHMRAHSDERPHQCNHCDKSYKTKNALQVHQRTHGQDKPYVCPHCSRAFREKGSLVRHIRHHTGEKPFKCSKCGRGFAEHGTLNRHLRAKGGCYSGQKELEQTDTAQEQQASADSVAATIISEDPHAVLVEFSSVVANTQEYIIGAPSEEATQGEEVALIQDNQNQMDNHIMKVVQQIVSQSHGGSRQIIVRNVAVDESASISDCGDTITIATPESLTEQVAMTLASAISDGTILTTEGPLETAHGTVTMVAAQDLEVMEQEEQYVITSPDEMEIQTLVV